MSSSCGPSACTQPLFPVLPFNTSRPCVPCAQVQPEVKSVFEFSPMTQTEKTLCDQVLSIIKTQRGIDALKDCIKKCLPKTFSKMKRPEVACRIQQVLDDNYVSEKDFHELMRDLSKPKNTGCVADANDMRQQIVAIYNNQAPDLHNARSQTKVLKEKIKMMSRQADCSDSDLYDDSDSSDFSDESFSDSDCAPCARPRRRSPKTKAKGKKAKGKKAKGKK